MTRRLEKSLSLILIILLMLVFAISAIPLFVDVQIALLASIWNILFVVAWLIMLFYQAYILFQKDSRGYSIFIAMVTGLAFILLSYHAIMMSSNYIEMLPKQLVISNELLLLNGQAIFYTSILVVYILHVINLVLLGRNTNNSKEEMDSKIEEKDSENIYINN